MSLCSSIGLISKIIIVLFASYLLELTHPRSNCDTPRWFMGFPFLPSILQSCCLLSLRCALPCIPASEQCKIVVVTSPYPPRSVSPVLEKRGAWWLESITQVQMHDTAEAPSMDFKVQTAWFAEDARHLGQGWIPVIWPYSPGCLLVWRLILDLAPYKVLSCIFILYS